MNHKPKPSKDFEPKGRLLHKKASYSSPHAFTPRCNYTTSTSEMTSMKHELAELKKTLNETLSEVALVKKQYEQETKTLQTSYEELKKEFETLRFEKDERQTKQTYGIEEYSQLTLELIGLRTEIDRLSNLYDRERRSNHMRIIENKLHESLLEDLN